MSELPIEPTTRRSDSIAYDLSNDVSSSGHFEKSFNHSQLPPTRLYDTHPRHRWLEIAGEFAVYAALGLLVFGATKVYKEQIRAVSNQPNPCERITASGEERWFVVDVQVTGELSFSKAKLIDVAWDTSAGQIGRISHGAIVYYVMVRTVTWMSESFATPYEFYVDMIFQPTSLDALWTTICMIVHRRRKPVKITLISIWALFSLLYILLMPTIWGAATGYISFSTPGAEVPRLNGFGNYVTKETDLVNLCWVLSDIDRVDKNHTGVVPGPKLSELNEPETLDGEFHHILETFPYYHEGSTGSVHITDEFKSVYTYLLTKSTVATFSRNSSSATIFRGPNNTTLVLNEWNDTAICEAVVSAKGMAYSSNEIECTNPTAGDLYFPTILGWQFADASQTESDTLTPSSYSPSAHTPGGDNWNNSALVLDMEITLYDERFERDPSAQPDDNGSMVPYNSTFWWRNETFQLEPPFLDVGGLANGTRCDHSANAHFPICLCAGETPITSGFPMDEDELVCIIQEEYVWGFASYITMMGIILEVIFLASCGLMWLVSGRSKLVRYNRDGSGPVRSALDLANAVERDLGSNTGAYREKVLIKALADQAPVGYVVEKEDGAYRIQLQSIPEGVKLRQNPRLDTKTLYA